MTWVGSGYPGPSREINSKVKCTSCECKGTIGNTRLRSWKSKSCTQFQANLYFYHSLLTLVNLHFPNSQSLRQNIMLCLYHKWPAVRIVSGGKKLLRETRYSLGISRKEEEKEPRRHDLFISSGAFILLPPIIWKRKLKSNLSLATMYYWLY